MMFFGFLRQKIVTSLKEQAGSFDRVLFKQNISLGVVRQPGAYRVGFVGFSTGLSEADPNRSSERSRQETR